MSDYSITNGNLTDTIPNQLVNDPKNNPQEEEEENEELIGKRALQIARGISFPMVLKSAMELNVLDILSEASERGVYLSASEVASEIPGCVNTHAPALLDRMLSLLASFSILKCQLRSKAENGKVEGGGGGVERVFSVAPICKYFLTKEGSLEGSIGPLFLLHHNKVFLESGTPFQRAYGMTSFEYMGIDPRFKNTFSRAMSNHTIFLMKKILDAYRGFEGIHVLVDVGGGIGSTLNLITSKYPDIKGINFDLPYVLAEAPTTNPRVEHVGGDMFVEVPKGDAIFMKWTLHDWSDDHCLKLLKNCWKALPENGKVIVVESLSSLTPENNYESQIALEQDIAMIVHNHGGKERTREEFEAFALESGFSSCNVVCSVYNSWVIEFHKIS